jgi:hypothetical protein
MYLPLLLAYIDPGAGSLFFQLLIASLMSASFFLRKYIFGAFNKLTGFFRRSKKKDYDA